MPNDAVHMIAHGRVQGVGFRFTVLRIADHYRLTGWVRNVSDGSVQMMAQGPAGDIDGCVRDIKESFAGCIRETKMEEVSANPQYKDFKITF